MMKRCRHVSDLCSVTLKNYNNQSRRRRCSQDLRRPRQSWNGADRGTGLGPRPLVESAAMPADAGVDPRAKRVWVGASLTCFFFITYFVSLRYALFWRVAYSSCGSNLAAPNVGRTSELAWGQNCDVVRWQHLEVLLNAACSIWKGRIGCAYLERRLFQRRRFHMFLNL